ncbi:putative sugar phosphate/phosphate translocator [Smittium mucronatum]|uniref:Putative sugar phosphate/phosphate translocator n=1 Tax=Smittium mucronatum TaxID=133383 RepID=A0A1R0H4A8_9FUNG|nr:putative sugar phosphate/phosphate translocator [Smittium mucronatum]
MSASAMSGVRWSMTQILIEKAKLGMNNPILTLSYLTPIMGIFLTILTLIFENPIFELPKSGFFDTFSNSISTIFLIAIGGFLATMMILSEFFLISLTSVLTLAVVGILKEVLMIILAVLIFGDQLTLINILGLFITIMGISLYNYLKVYGNLDMHKRGQTTPSLRGIYADVDSHSNFSLDGEFEMNEYSDSEPISRLDLDQVIKKRSLSNPDSENPFNVITHSNAINSDSNSL